MHVIFRESRGLEETATPRDLGQDPADLVVLSFSDSDLAAFAAGWRRGRAALPSLRLANLAELRHPLSVDTYIERTLSHARGILVRLIGGEPYWSIRAGGGCIGWRRSAASLWWCCRRTAATICGWMSSRPLPVSALRRLKVLCDKGGPVAAQAVIAQLALASGLLCRASRRRDRSSPRPALYDPRAWCHRGAAGIGWPAASAGDVLSLLSRGRRHRAGRCVDRCVAREGL